MGNAFQVMTAKERRNRAPQEAQSEHEDTSATELVGPTDPGHDPANTIKNEPHE